MPTPSFSDRLFVCIGLPEPCQRALLELMEPMDGVRWTRPEQLHLTLRFLGDVVEEQAQEMVARLQQIEVEPFLLPLEGVGAFPPRGPAKILWVGTGTAHTRLFQLRQRVDDALLAAGWQGELRSFEPHITVGRVLTASRKRTDEWLKTHGSFIGPAFRVMSFQLIASDLTSSGPVHRVHTEFALGAPSSH
jgi:RNA 2',3'-cyclic 3'-phosphodiesterase